MRRLAVVQEVDAPLRVLVLARPCYRVKEGRGSVTRGWQLISLSEPASQRWERNSLFLPQPVCGILS